MLPLGPLSLNTSATPLFILWGFYSPALPGGKQDTGGTSIATSWGGLALCT